MTLAHKTSNNAYSQAGISLLEVVVALFLLGLLMTFGTLFYNGRVDDTNLRQAVSEIEAMAASARTLSFLKQVPHRLCLSGSQTIKLEQPSDSAEIKGFTTRKSFEAKVQIALRRWGAADNAWQNFESHEEKKHLNWYFSPSGLCEPISIRLTDGENWIVLHMDALTGRIQEEESYIK